MKTNTYEELEKSLINLRIELHNAEIEMLKLRDALQLLASATKRRLKLVSNEEQG